jgi:predicted transcriptional regulator
MKLAEVVRILDLEVRSAHRNLDREVTGGYASDLLSDVIANAAEGDLWITLQTHVNTVAVASMKEISGIILVNGREPAEEARQKADTEGIPMMVSKLPTFELAGRLYDLGLRGRTGAGIRKTGHH